MTLDRTLSIALSALAITIAAAQAPLAPEHFDLGASTHGAAKAAFIENRGQLPGQVLYRADFGTIALFAEKDRITWSKFQDNVGELVHDQQHLPLDQQQPFPVHGHAWVMHLVEPNPAVNVTNAGRSTGILNFFIGNDPTKWASDVHYYDEVTYHDLWNGVDLRLHGGEQGGFKYDVTLAPDADVNSVRFSYEGLNSVELGHDGHLILRTSVGDIEEATPVAWYADGAKEKVSCAFTVKEGRVGFRFAKGTDTGRPIVIDPLLIASTLSGTGNLGQTQNYGHTATYDDAGNIYTGCICFGQGYPVTPGAFDLTYGGGFGVDIAVSKLNPDGSSLIYATYLGGSGGDYPHSMVVTPNNELCVYGSTDSPNYPVSATAYDASFNGGNADIVITKLNVTGTALVGSTYIGTTASDGRNTLTSNYGDSYRGEIISDALGRPMVSSCSDGTFPTTPGAYQTANAGGQDGVVFCLNNDLSGLVWSTMLGTSSGDMCFGIKQDSFGDIYVGGATASTAFPIVPGAYQNVSAGAMDGFIAHFTGSGTTLANSTYFGGTGPDAAFFIQLDIDDDVYIYGQSTAGTIPISPPSTYGTPGADIFIAEFSPDLTTNIFKSVVGAAGGFGNSCVPVAFLVDVCGHIYISGYNTYGNAFATTAGALYTTGGFYLAAYDVDMTSLLYGTYYDGASHVDGGTSRFDKNGIVYQAVCTSGPFPTTATAFSNVQPGGWDIGVFKIDFQVSGVHAAGASTVNSGCAPILIDFLNTSTGTDWVWDFGDGSPLDYGYTPSHLYTTPGSFTVTLIAMDSLSCNLADTVSLVVTIGAATPITAAFSAVQNVDCTVSQVITTNQSSGSPLAFEWNMGDGTVILTDTSVVHNYSAPGNYNIQLLVYDPTGCAQPDSITQPITILPPVLVDAGFTVSQVPDCNDLIVSTNNTTVGPAPSYIWDMGDGSPLQYTTNVNYTYTTPGTYTITLIANDAASCNVADTVQASIQVVPAAPVSAGFTIDQTFNCTQLVATATNSSTGSFLGFQWNMGDGSPILTDTNLVYVYNGAGTYDITLIVNDLLGCSPSDTAYAQVTIDPLIPVVADFTISQIGTCTLLQVDGTNLSTGDSVSYSWNMGDGSPALVSNNVSYNYTNPGTYNVTLTVTDLGCGQNDQMTLPVTMINEIPTPLVSDGVVCYGENLVLDATTNANTYLWSNGATTSTITVVDAGQWSVQVYTATCYGTDTVDVIAGQLYDLGFEVEACPDALVDLTVPFDYGVAYSWSTGGTQRTESVIGAGDYIFTVTDTLGCLHTDTATIKPLDADARLFAPNAFTPDGDGINDEFNISGYGSETVDLKIFNRWGEQIYATNRLGDPWDGRYKGNLVKQDVYVYVLKYNAHCATSEFTTTTGHVSVLK